jgi:hypothetical protein
VKLLTDFLELLSDLVIGDCWQIAAGVVVVLGAGIGLLQINAVSLSSFAVFLGVTIMSCAALIIYFEARMSYRKVGVESEPGKSDGA